MVWEGRKSLIRAKLDGIRERIEADLNPRQSTSLLPHEVMIHTLSSRYEKGQHFLAHEDGFPPGLARSNGFQVQRSIAVGSAMI